MVRNTKSQSTLQFHVLRLQKHIGVCKLEKIDFDRLTTEEFIEWRKENPFTGDFTEEELEASQQEFLNRDRKKAINE